MRRITPIFFLILSLIVSNISIVSTESQSVKIEEPSITDFGKIEGIKVKLDRDSGELTISKWDDEVSLTLSTLDTPESNYVEDAKEILEYSGYTARVYEIAVGMEFEIVFFSRPVSNRIEFKIESKGLKFYYQGPLSDEVFPKGWTVNETHAIDESGKLREYRPLNITGSYAVYGLKTGNEYKTGKVGHIYRPLIYDSKGSEVYGEMRIEGTILSIIVPELWFDNAVYPVTIDPIFGKTVIGGTIQWGGKNFISGTNYEVGDGSGQVTHISVYLDAVGGVGEVKVGIYNVTGEAQTGDPVNVLWGSGSQDPAVEDAWETFAVPGGSEPTVNNGSYYFLCFRQSDDLIKTYYDNVIVDNGKAKWIAFGDPWPDPLGGITNSSRQQSMYANYTVFDEDFYYLDVENLSLSTVLVATNITVSMDLETNSTPAFYWFGHNSSGEWENTTAVPWALNETVYGWFWASPQIGYPFEVIGYANTTDNFNSTSGFFITVRDTVNLITEWVWIFLGLWVFVTVFGLAKKDSIVRMIAGFFGIAFGVLYLSTSYLVGLGMVLLNFYLLYDSIDDA